MQGRIIRVGTIVGLVPVMAAGGRDLARALKAVGLAADALEDPDKTIPYATAGRLLAHCAQLLGCPWIGVLVGTQAGPESLGRLGYVLTSAPDLRTALRALEAHSLHHDQGGRVRLVAEGDIAGVAYDVVDPATPGMEHVTDTAAAIGMNLLRAVCGPHWWPTEVLLRRRAPADVAAHRRAFGRRIRFGAGEVSLRFPAADLAIRPPSPQPALHALLLRDLDGKRLEAAGTVGAVSRAIQVALGDADCSCAAIARQFGTTPRSLQRRLAAERTSFHALQETVRRAELTRLLAGTDLPLGEMALRLGYSDLSAFVRAFRRWEGMPPAQWRASRPGRRRPAPAGTA